ncbi:MAG: hypothetical protein HGA75_09930 [Thiobacillus sp.]|nr:hypothetical protein [Thiobacillus sp.]
MWSRARLAVLPDRVGGRAGRRSADAAVPAGQPDGLAKALAEVFTKLPCKEPVEVVLSHALASIWLLAMPDHRLDWQETQGWAREQLAAKLGERITRYRLACQPAEPGEPLLVSAIDEEWLAGLLTALASRNVKAASVQPWLAAAGNRWRSRMRRKAGWLAMAEPGRLTLAFFDRGTPRAVRGIQLTEDMAAALTNAVRREALLAGVSDQAPVWLEAAGVQADWAAGGLDVRRLTPGDGDARVLIGG